MTNFTMSIVNIHLNGMNFLFTFEKKRDHDIVLRVGYGSFPIWKGISQLQFGSKERGTDPKQTNFRSTTQPEEGEEVLLNSM